MSMWRVIIGLFFLEVRQGNHGKKKIEVMGLKS